MIGLVFSAYLYVEGSLYGLSELVYLGDTVSLFIKCPEVNHPYCGNLQLGIFSLTLRPRSAYVQILDNVSNKQ